MKTGKSEHFLTIRILLLILIGFLCFVSCGASEPNPCMMSEDFIKQDLTYPDEAEFSTFGTFENSTPGWFDWLSLIVSVVAILATYFISKRVLKTEIRYQKLKEKEADQEHFKYFEEIILNHVRDLTTQIEYIDIYLKEIKNTKNSVLTTVTSVQYDILYGFDLHRLLKSANEKAINREDFRRLISNLKYTEKAFESIQTEVLRTFEKIDTIDRANSVTQYELLRKDYFALIHRMSTDKDFCEENYDLGVQYRNLIKALKDNKEVFPDDGSLIKKENLPDLFYIPLLKIIEPSISKDEYFIIIASKINYALNDLNNIKIIEENHVNVINSYKKLFESTVTLINRIFPPRN